MTNLQSERALPCKISELNLDLTLPGGQSFRWKKINEKEWRGVFGSRIWTLSQNEDFLNYTVFPTTNFKEEKQLLENYFQLTTCLADMYTVWKKMDTNFSEVSPSFTGVRVLKQDPTENLFSFICSSNNNISRISTMVEKMCTLYGETIGTIDNVTYYSFPRPIKLAQVGVEAELKLQKFGYRASYIYKTAKILAEKKEIDWLNKLREMNYEEAHQALLELPGVGPKVADCVCLMSLDKTQAIPVDTHMFKIASQCYLPSLKSHKTLTEKSYKQIGDHFRNIFGNYAGWAHSVLFSSDLGQFKRRSDDNCKVPKKKSRKNKI